jgi:peptidoglycan/LPS O-acetylase OafA/YrhL
MNKVHFPGLNALRFLAALSVIIGHVELIKSIYCIHNFLKVIPFFDNTSGHLGVILFFVFSGFLITYLLLTEKGIYGKVNIKKFYMRRILRIWPLYFLVLLLVFLLIPLILKDPSSNAFFTSKNIICSLLLYVFFLPNLALQLGIWVPFGTHLWSIGVEEQFYLTWPFLINFFRKKILLILILIFVGVTLLPHFIDFITNHFTFRTGVLVLLKQFSKFFIVAKFNSMAMGGIMAWLFYSKKESVLKIINNRVIEVFIFVITFSLWILGFMPAYFGDEFYSILFSIIILNISTIPKPLISLENRFFEYLGKISYGLYMYHWLSIVIVLYILRNFLPLLELPKNAIYYNLLMYPMAIALTIGLSAFSFEIYEKWFMNLKKQYAKISSG